MSHDGDAFDNVDENAQIPPIPRRLTSTTKPNHPYQNDPKIPTKAEESKRMKLLTQMSMSNFHAPTVTKRRKLKKLLRSGTSVAFVPDGQAGLVVADDTCGKVLKFSDNLRLEVELLTDARPFGIVFTDPDTVVITNNKNNCGSVKTLSLSTGRQIGCWGTALEKFEPHGVTLTKHDQIVVANIHKESSLRATIFTRDGQEVKSFGRAEGPGDMKFQRPHYVTVDIFGRLLFSDVDGNCVKVFDSRGQYLSTFGGGKAAAAIGCGAGIRIDSDSALCQPHGICCDSRGNVIVCDTGNQRLAMFASDGRFLHNLLQTKQGLVSPIDVAVDESGEKLALTVHNLDETFRKLVVYDFNQS